MDKKSKQKKANLIMVLLIALILAAGVGAAGYILGWFGGSGKAASLTNVKGIVNLTRNAVTYPVEETTELRDGDIIECTPGGSATVSIMPGSALAIAEQAVLTVTDASQKAFSAEITNGELFAIVGQDAKASKISFGSEEVSVQEAVISVSVHANAHTLNVFKGEAGGIAAGNCILWTGDEREERALSVEMLNAFAITQLKGLGDDAGACFTVAELNDLETKRKEEAKNAAGAAALDVEDADSFDGECTVTIVCDTILDNMDKFDPAKMEFLPDDGIIIDTVKVPFKEGETAYDVTKRACNASGVVIEASWTPLYDAYYIEGINNIYEFDCGSESGWMYKVNGWFPNYGCSSYEIQEGDSVEWCYTCVGLGVDVGGVGY